MVKRAFLVGAMLLLASLLVLGCGAPDMLEGRVEAANTEVANVELAAKAYYADNGNWPSNSDELTADGLLTRNSLYRGDLGKGYQFDSYGGVGNNEPADGESWPADSRINWSATHHEWTK